MAIPASWTNRFQGRVEARCHLCRTGSDDRAKGGCGVAGEVKRFPRRKYFEQWDHDSVSVPGLGATCFASELWEMDAALTALDAVLPFARVDVMRGPGVEGWARAIAGAEELLR